MLEKSEELKDSNNKTWLALLAETSEYFKNIYESALSKGIITENGKLIRNNLSLDVLAEAIFDNCYEDQKNKNLLN